MPAEIFVYDEIGPDWLGMVSAKYVLDGLAKAKGEPVVVRVNSPGGDVFEGQAIYNALRRHGAKITIEIDALAASAASFIAMAGDEVRIAENAMMMIHNAWTFTAGDKARHLAVVDLLDKIDGTIVDTYLARSGDKATREDLVAKMDAETWLTAKEAVALGLADSIGQPLNVAACLKEGRYRNAPAALLKNSQAPPRERERDQRIAAIQFANRIAAARKLA